MNQSSKNTAPHHFLALEPEQWKELFLIWGEKAFRAEQVRQWIYLHGALHPDQMSNLSQTLRQRLCTEIDWTLPEVQDRLEASDGTTKLLLRGQRGQLIEAVIMRYAQRTTLCVSSQVGCKLACSFCQTGKLGFFRNLSLPEILAQLVLSNQILKGEGRKVSNVVFMGMGEPFDNYDNSVQAANRMIHPDGYGLSARHVTLSTSGLADKIRRLATESRASLALSLHAANDILRTEMMPINRRFPLAPLKDALLDYQKTTGRKITIEYILIQDLNCQQQHAKELIRFLQGIKVKVNLIPFNSHPGMPFERPTEQQILDFQRYLVSRSIPAPVRYSRGLEASAACGQLAMKYQKELLDQPSRKQAVGKFLPTETQASH